MTEPSPRQPQPQSPPQPGARAGRTARKRRRPHPARRSRRFVGAASVAGMLALTGAIAATTQSGTTTSVASATTGSGATKTSSSSYQLERELVVVEHQLELDHVVGDLGDTVVAVDDLEPRQLSRRPRRPPVAAEGPSRDDHRPGRRHRHHHARRRHATGFQPALAPATRPSRAHVHAQRRHHRGDRGARRGALHVESVERRVRELVLHRRGQERDGQLEGLLLRLDRSGQLHHRRQAARRVVGASAVRSASSDSARSACCSPKRSPVSRPC